MENLGHKLSYIRMLEGAENSSMDLPTTEKILKWLEYYVWSFIYFLTISSF